MKTPIQYVDLSKTDPSEEHEIKKQLLKDIYLAVHADDSSARDKAQEWLDRIDRNWKNYNARADETKDSPKLKEVRASLRNEIKKYKILIADHVSQPLFLYCGSATENPFIDTEERKRLEEKHEAKHREHRAELEKHLAYLSECLANPSWGRGKGTIESMKGGTPESNFAADIVMMFKDFRPNSGSSKEAGDLHVLGECVFKWITGDDVYFNLEHYLKIALRQFNAAKHNS